MQPVDSDVPNPRVTGRRLQDARKARGLTQQEAADRLNVARTTLTAIEKGERRVQPSELMQLAVLYGRTVNELLRHSEPVDAFTLRFRHGPSSTGISQTEVKAAKGEFQRLCEDYLELEQMRNTSLSRKYPVEYAIGTGDVDADAEEVAVSERNRLGLGDGPLLNLREILEFDVGIRIFLMDLPSRVAAMFAYSDALGACIALNRKHPEERRRMS